MLTFHPWPAVPILPSWWAWSRALAGETGKKSKDAGKDCTKLGGGHRGEGGVLLMQRTPSVAKKQDHQGLSSEQTKPTLIQEDTGPETKIRSQVQGIQSQNKRLRKQKCLNPGSLGPKKDTKTGKILPCPVVGKQVFFFLICSLTGLELTSRVQSPYLGTHPLLQFSRRAKMTENFLLQNHPSQVATSDYTLFQIWSNSIAVR